MGTHGRRLCLFTELKAGEGYDQVLRADHTPVQSANAVVGSQAFVYPEQATRLRTTSRFGQGKRLGQAAATAVECRGGSLPLFSGIYALAVALVMDRTPLHHTLT